MLTLLLIPGLVLAASLLSGCDGDSSGSGGGDPPPPPDIPTIIPASLLRSSHSSPIDPPRSPCPEEMSQVASVCVDRFEAHLEVGNLSYPHSHRPPADPIYRAASARGYFPQAYISRHEAAEACGRAEKRLCTLSEWLNACKGSQSFLYSYGNQYEAGRCNHGKPHLMMQLFKDKPKIAWTYGDFNDPALNETPNFLAKSAEYFGCVNEDGIYDMVGNLHEWVSDAVSQDLPNRIHLNQALTKKYKSNLGFGIFMGGFYSTSHEHGSGCEFITIGHEPAYHDYSTGFRCCKDPG